MFLKAENERSESWDTDNNKTSHFFLKGIERALRIVPQFLMWNGMKFSRFIRFFVSSLRLRPFYQAKHGPFFIAGNDICCVFEYRAHSVRYVNVISDGKILALPLKLQF